MSQDTAGGYPAKAYLNFTPGGIIYSSSDKDAWVDLNSYSPSNAKSTSLTSSRRAAQTPSVIIHKAKAADDRLRQYILLQDSLAPIFLPSLSVLAGAVFGRLTGVSPTTVKQWADAMVLHYAAAAASSSSTPETIPTSVKNIYNVKPTATPTLSPKQTTASLLQSFLSSSTTHELKRPCGYVFKRGDIAWNCRTCQTDATCVICDACFAASNHEGHEVYFHRTTPGGCCDCGDVEAWAIDGCCPSHAPRLEELTHESSLQDLQEAVRVSEKCLQDGIATLTSGSTALPKHLLAALGVVIGAAVECLVHAVDGAGVGADPIQWKLRWADEACRILNGVCTLEDYYVSEEEPMMTLAQLQHVPASNKLHLRLHNDDVHTFEEVIDALYDPRHSLRSNTEGEEDASNISLVTHREDASEMTHHVDADGQVTVKSFTKIDSALKGYRRLKSRGLHCAVVTQAQVDLELRAKQLTTWLSEVAAAHPAARLLVVHALVQVSETHALGDVQVWREARMIPSWAGLVDVGEMEQAERRFRAFPPQLASSYLTREEAELLHRMGAELNAAQFIQLTGTDLNFYNRVPCRLPSERYRKSPHALWGTLPSTYSDTRPPAEKHPLLYHLSSGQVDVTMKNRLAETVMVVDTDLRKQQETDRILSSVYAHKLPGLYMISGVGSIPLSMIDSYPPAVPNPMEWRHLLATSSFRAPVSPILLLLLLDPYPTKQVRAGLHALFLSLLIDQRFKCRFAAALGSVAYRPLSTLFCAGIGTEADTPLGFTVQIFTAGSLVRALSNAVATEKLLKSDDLNEEIEDGAPVGVFTLPIAHNIVRCIHTNLLGATKEVHMILNNTAAGNDDDSREESGNNDSLLPALTYLAGEHPLLTPLPAAPDDGFLDSRSTRHKRLPHLLRDLEYVIETPGTAIRLLLPNKYPVHPALSTNSRDDLLAFGTVWARLLRTAQGMDPQKRKISGGHVEYEQNRWLEAFGLSLNFAGTRDALAESPTNSSSAAIAPVSADGSHLVFIHEAVGNLFASLLREIKFWLYREGMLETGLPIPPGGAHGGLDLLQLEALQRSTLHISTAAGSSANAVALACATGVKMTEAQLELIESALRIEGAQRQERISSSSSDVSMSTERETSHSEPPAMNDWLRVPHSPLAGDSLSFHLPLHRAFAKSVRTLCSVVVPDAVRNYHPRDWWKLPVIDDDFSDASSPSSGLGNQHPLAALIRSTLRSANCRVVWAAGPECTPPEAQRRRSRAKTVAANIACAKIIHSIADHPIRCLAAAQQIERHLWARNGSSTAGMALNYSSAPLCRSFRDLDLTLVQLSAAGLTIGLGARRVFALLISRFSMDGYLCDPERRQGSTSSPTSGYGSGNGGWVNPPRLQDPDHAAALSESFFATMCVLVTELPPPPPVSPSDNSALRDCIRRELLHALAAKPRSFSEAMEAATSAASRRDENGGLTGSNSGSGLLGDIFAAVLRDIGKQKSSRAASGPSAYELQAGCCEEYDPTFYHLRRPEHQHAMDTVATLRRQKAIGNKDSNGSPDSTIMPVVCPPPKAHPRFLPCRLLLHLQPMDAAIRRSLLFALTGGSWLPPEEQTPPNDKFDDDENDSADEGNNGVTKSTTGPFPGAGEQAAVPVTTFRRRSFRTSGSTVGTGRRSFSDSDPAPFSPAVVASSSVSFLEILQLLTLQVHTLEECASLHRAQAELDEETKLLSSSLSVNSYLGRLIHVPESLVDEWSLRPFPDGPLPSKGSGENRGSILGLLIALYEHRSDHGGDDKDGLSDSAHGDEGHGGARSLAASGLKWLLRFVNALVDGASSVGSAAKSASSGIPCGSRDNLSSSSSDWTLDPMIRLTVSGMLSNLSDLWPKTTSEMSPESNSISNDRGREARKAAQQRVMEMMKKKQEAFVKTLAPSETGTDEADKMDDGEDADLCIICRCDDADGENNGPLGYLGHVQRSRAAQIRASTEATKKIGLSSDNAELWRTYRVVGHRGCQLRATEAMDSEQLVCLPTGSIVTVAESTVSDKYDILSRRVLVRHVDKDPLTGAEKVSEGWASVQSSEGYVILSPLASLCYANTRWGSTRPVIRQCGHAAHSKCVEQHILSLHSRAAGDQPYDGRFAANIDDGEFLCPLCKQLSNIVVPRDGCARKDVEEVQGTSKRLRKSVRLSTESHTASPQFPECLTKETILRIDEISDIGRQAIDEFGSNLYQAMNVPWERASSIKRRKQHVWDPAIQHWDYEDKKEDEESAAHTGPVLRLLRQQHIAWASVGHSAAAAEESTRAVEKILPFGAFAETSDPWVDYASSHLKDTHPMLLEMRRILTATSGLLEVLTYEMDKCLRQANTIPPSGTTHVIGLCIASMLQGRSWMHQLVSSISSQATNSDIISQLTQLTALMASMPCHVARDGMISQRHEARAAAAAMWAMKGNGTAGAALDEPPVPYAVRQVDLQTYGKPADIPANWGTMDPFVSTAVLKMNFSELERSLPFRPGVASSFLYMPLLAWDFNTLAGAVFSTMLATDADQLPTSTEFLQAARLLLFGRLVQCIITPGGFDASVIVDDDELLEFWPEGELRKQKAALANIVVYCRKILKARSLDVQTATDIKLNDEEAGTLFGAVGSAMLPFARSLILLLRAATSVVRLREKTTDDSTQDDKLLSSLLGDEKVMSSEDGFLFLKELGGPLPSNVTEGSDMSLGGDSWWSLMNRWLLSAVGLEINHTSHISVSADAAASSFPDKAIGNGTAEGAAGYGTPDASSGDLPSANGNRAAAAMQQVNEEAQDEAMAEDVDGQEVHMMFDNNVLMDDELADSDEDMMDIDDVEEEMVAFAAEQLGVQLGVIRAPLTQHPLHPLTSDLLDDTSDDNSNGNVSEMSDKVREVENKFAGVGRSPILPYQPSLLGLVKIGPGRQGAPFEYDAASRVMCDLSHLGMIHRRGIATNCLIRLPKSFVELYGLVNRVRGRDEPSISDETDESGSSETAICLLTGAVMRSGSARRPYSRLTRPPGACTLHARQVGSGTGIFFLVQKCTVLLMHNNKSAYSASLYVDQHGEEDPGLRRGRPLFLNEARYRELEMLWRQQGIPREVAQIRSTSDRVIRDNWY